MADKKNANSKDTKEDKSSDSPVELDSRILSALLTVSPDVFFFLNTRGLCNLIALRLQINLFLITPLQGVNRAFPYVSTDEADDIIESQTPVLFKLVTSESLII